MTCTDSCTKRPSNSYDLFARCLSPEDDALLLNKASRIPILFYREPNELVGSQFSVAFSFEWTRKVARACPLMAESCRFFSFHLQLLSCPFRRRAMSCTFFIYRIKPASAASHQYGTISNTNARPNHRNINWRS